jgi:outer membrane lipoprotein-sorting protein
MKRIFFIAAGWLLGILPPAGAQEAAEILAKAAAACKQPGGLSASFALHTRSEQMAESLEGTIHVKGDKFVLETPDVKTWYDGRAQWTYMERAGEVSVTVPEGDELQFTNPAILLGSYQKNFTALVQSEGTAVNGKAAYNIELRPRKKTDIVKVELQIEKFSSLPVRIVVQLKNKTSNTIRISNIQTNENRPDQFFSFPKAAYPNAEIIDLRL